MLDECLQAAANTCDLPADVLLTSLAVACINRCPQGLCCLLVSASQVADHSLLVLVAWALGPAGNQAAGNCCHSLLQHQTPRHWRLLQFQQQIGSSPLSQQAGFLQRCPCRPYLQQRTHSAVCYLQRAGADFWRRHVSVPAGQRRQSRAARCVGCTRQSGERASHTLQCADGLS